MKRFYYILFLFLSAGLLYFLFNGSPQLKHDSRWKRVTVINKQIRFIPVHKSEAEKMHLPQDENTSDTPNPELANLKKLHGRILTGSDQIDQLDLSDIELENRINPAWDKLYVESVKRVLGAKDQIYIKHLNGLVLITKEENHKALRGRYVELVVVNTVLEIENKKSSQSFKAYIDSQTGQVVSTWDQTLQDNLGLK